MSIILFMIIARDLSEVKGIESSLRYHSHAGKLCVSCKQCCISAFYLAYKVSVIYYLLFIGFFTVNETTNSNMYFWFFPAKVSVFCIGFNNSLCELG